MRAYGIWAAGATSVAARILLAGIFLVSGPAKLLDVHETAADIAALGLPFPVLAALAAGVLEVVCGVLLVLGLKSGWAAAALFLFMVPVTLLMEHPFRGPGAVYDFLKNAAIMGGLLLAVAAEWDALRADLKRVRGR